MLQPSKVPDNVKCPLECPITSNEVDGLVTSIAESLELRKNEKVVNSDFKGQGSNYECGRYCLVSRRTNQLQGKEFMPTAQCSARSVRLIPRGGMIDRLPFYTHKG